MVKATKINNQWTHFSFTTDIERSELFSKSRVHRHIWSLK